MIQVKAVPTRLILLFIHFSLVLLCGGCKNGVSTHGYEFNEERIAKIQPNRSHLNDVLANLGTPTASAVYGEPKFFYILHQYRERALLNPQISDQKILEIVFYKNGIVRSVTRYGMKDFHELSFSKEKTVLPGNDVGIIEQIVGNMGKFNNTDGLRKAGT